MLSGYITSTVHAEEETVTHIYIDQAKGVNSSSTPGTEGEPFKSITYAMLVFKNQGTPNPWTVHIKAGTYNSDPTKPENEQEVFPIELRDNMTIQGDDGAENCIISGVFNTDIYNQLPILRGEGVSDITVKDLTLRDMKRTGDGGGCYLSSSSGSIEGCLFKNNQASYGGGIYVSVFEGKRFDITGNTFSEHFASYGGGVYVPGGLTGNITGNTFSQNTAKTGGGVYVLGSLTGNITGNTFSQNTVYSLSFSYGGGVYVLGSLTGNITGNTFSQNSAYSSGGGVYVYGGLTGNITGNTFSGNSATYGFGGGVSVNGLFTGSIDLNLFSNNSVEEYGGGFYLNNSGGDSITVSNNFFLYNSISGTLKLKGSGFYSNQNVAVVNNTFY